MGNRPEFHVADVAVLLARRHADLDLQLVVARADRVPRRTLPRPSVAIVEDAAFLDRVLEVRDDLPTLASSSWSTGRRPRASTRGTSCSPPSPVDLDGRRGDRRRRSRDVIYTSGTTGAPKGVMLDHPNICWTIDSLREALGVRARGSRLVSYLPMAHIAERMTTHYAGVAFGYEVTTCADIRTARRRARRDATAHPLRCAAHLEKIHSRCSAVLAADPEAPRCSRRRSRSAPRRRAPRPW